MRRPLPVERDDAPSAKRLLEVISGLRGRRILTLADLVADEFIDGRVQRVSREAPVLILEHCGTELRLGGGANAVHNLAALGGVPIPLGVLGRDEYGRRLKAALKKKGIATGGILGAAGYFTPVKTRILAGGVHSTKQQVVRVDRLGRLSADSAVHERVQRALRRLSRGVDGILLSDYGLGLVRPDTARAAIRLARKLRVPITVDTRYGLLAFHGMTAVTPNEPEVEAALGIRIGHDRLRLERAGRSLLERLGAAAVLITRGSDGMALFEPGRAPLHIPVHGTDQVADVTGAGDTVIAAFTLALAAGATAAEAARLANYAGGLVVMKRGTATVSARELRAAVLMEASSGAAPAGWRG